MSSFTISLNQANVVSGTTNSRYSYNFPAGGVYFSPGFEVALQSLSMYYSWPNLTTSNNNNAFSYSWQGVTFSVNVPSGFYTISELNSYLQSVMVTNNHYLINSSGNYVYFLEMATNSSLYAIQLNCYPIPTAAEATTLGYTTPSGWGGFPVTSETPLFIIPSTNVQDVLGIYAGTYPSVAQSTVYSKTSDYTPQVTPTSSVYLLVNLVNNRYGLPQNIIYNFTPNVTYGSQITVVPPQLVYSKIQEGSYSNISIQFVDQNFKALNVLDSNISVLLSIREPIKQ